MYYIREKDARRQKIYRRFLQYINRNSKYISDFHNISTVTLIISAVRHRISTYRHFPTIVP
ncbi:hypothetical protein CN931_05390 [Bacillus sp. AFS054943]|uniref:Uncharacterized protein n=1 Tax=Bacillus cereus TaxID=1396 RepID=A0A2A8ITQ1_BACCE|nr:hypothetical protein CN476_18555 [Bacillus cereus]PFA63438.1 hypothetical protein CN402_07060 [Bacillus sp. AFS015896]PGL86719.1 hypothetical protein CN931_05390 [Bacillus sp. AFS054943]PGX10029.1 hypothetical protein COE07_18985 [Bacillus sp. AFS033286]PGZ76093.1 hypothetical protein COE49_03250 [Bacillus sp. AFS029637]